MVRIDSILISYVGRGDKARRGSSHAYPVLCFPFHSFMNGTGQRAELGSALGWGRTPIGPDPSTHLQSLWRRKNGSLVQAQAVIAKPFNALRYPKAVHPTQSFQGLQDH
jgi:hypothetical protein